MAKIKSKIHYLCSDCGDEFPKWHGQCPSCKEWGTLSEFKVTGKRSSLRSKALIQNSRSLTEVLAGNPGERFNTGMSEVDRVLGGGLLSGSLILLGGNPGVGKSTLALQLGNGDLKILYVTAEESEDQVAIRAKRLGIQSDQLHLSGENEIHAIESHISTVNPQLVVVDSIQTIYNEELDSIAGSISQIRECGQQLLSISKQKNVAILIIGHVTKEGTIAGPKMLEHMVDTVLYLEGDDRHDHRSLRSVKNRFGPTHEVGIFQMEPDGLSEVSNPSELFLAERSENIPGTSIFPSLEGTRPILVEVQALVSNANYGTPQRNVNGFDYKRLSMLLAVLEKRMKTPMGSKDVFVNLVGGLRVDDPAADLSILCSVASSSRDQSIPDGMIIIGEVGLAGEIRSVGQIDKRLQEASALGFTHAIIPNGNYNEKTKKIKITLHPAKTVQNVFGIIF